MARSPVTLRQCRKVQGLTLDHVAVRARCSVEVVRDLEAGVRIAPDEELRTRLAHAYGLSLREFMSLALDAADGWESSRDAHP